MKRLLHLSIVALIAALSVACAEEEVKRTLPKFETYTYEATQDNLALSISYERIANSEASVAFKLIDSMNYHSTFGDFATEPMNLEASAELMKEDLELSATLFGGSNCEMRIYQVAYFVRNESVVCFDTCTETYFGGAHPSTTQNYECYDVATGTPYDFSYLAEGDGVDNLQKLIYDDLVRQHGDRIIIASPNDLHLPNAIHITDRGLMFHYEPYEVGDYALGSVNVELSDKQLTDAGVTALWK
jgi:hypothetical protein